MRKRDHVFLEGGEVCSVVSRMMEGRDTSKES